MAAAEAGVYGRRTGIVNKADGPEAGRGAGAACKIPIGGRAEAH